MVSTSHVRVLAHSSMKSFLAWAATSSQDDLPRTPSLTGATEFSHERHTSSFVPRAVWGMRAIRFRNLKRMLYTARHPCTSLCFHNQRAISSIKVARGIKSRKELTWLLGTAGCWWRLQYLLRHSSGMNITVGSELRTQIPTAWIWRPLASFEGFSGNNP